MRVSSLHIYPVKGARAVNCDQATTHARGFCNDRRWLVTDADYRFLTQRECPALAQLIALPGTQDLSLSFEGCGEFTVASPESGERSSITIWKDRVGALRASADADAWLSDALGRAVRLYYMDDAATRDTSGRWGAPAPVSFADGYPFLITTTQSLEALNQEIACGGGAAVGMERFRPNIVIDADRSWAEDYWKVIKIGDVTFDLAKPCVRCVVTTKDQRTGESLGKEPLKSLGRIRRSTHPELSGALFGWNATPGNQGEVRVGDAVEVVEDRPEGWPLA
ncbi:MAG: MOSC domain-containing protein [Alphaproteobacteria bacterium]|nr:MOSC domain-containing protein [Alphaproteobacteria bacterium]